MVGAGADNVGGDSSGVRMVVGAEIVVKGKVAVEAVELAYVVAAVVVLVVMTVVTGTETWNGTRGVAGVPVALLLPVAVALMLGAAVATAVRLVKIGTLVGETGTGGKGPSREKLVLMELTEKGPKMELSTEAGTEIDVGSDSVGTEIDVGKSSVGTEIDVGKSSVGTEMDSGSESDAGSVNGYAFWSVCDDKVDVDAAGGPSGTVAVISTGEHEVETTTVKLGDPVISGWKGSSPEVDEPSGTPPEETEGEVAVLELPVASKLAPCAVPEATGVAAKVPLPNGDVGEPLRGVDAETKAVP